MSLTAFSNELSAIAAKTSASVVTIHTHRRHRMSPSGIIWDKGLIITTDSGLRRDENLSVTLPDGTHVAAELKGRDPSTDLALLACDTGTAAQLSFSDQPARLAEIILTVGRTTGTGPIVTTGIVSGIAGEWQSWRGAKLDEFVRLDASIYPTSIGGAVVNSEGNALGIVSGGLSRSSVIVITRRTIDRVAEALNTRGRVARGYIGIGLQPVAIPQALKTKFNIEQETGIMALSVEENGPAAQAGMMMGDVLIALNNRPVTGADALHAALDPTSVGQQFTAVILRGADRHELPVTIGERPSKSGE
jgi:S1-C subfamily serine protease